MAGNSNVGMGDLVSQIGSFNRVFWIANTMEMFERLAYYGLRTVIPVYMVLAVEQGGPQFDHIQKGSIFALWALVQSGLPVFTGGYADRYGYKLTVGVAIAVKVAGYLVMAYAIEIAAAMTGGASMGVAGHTATYNAFLAGALLLAAGTAIFKPGLQGIIAIQLQRGNDSVGWALFYQLVNVGGFLGPFLAAWMRLLDWKWVFISCAIIVCVNYLLLLTFAEPPKIKEDEEDVDADADASFLRVFWNSCIGICEPRLLSFLVVFSGFWMMFHQLFDLLPNFIDDWVDSSMVLDAVIAPLFTAAGSEVPAEWGGMVPQEWMINLNAGMCMLLAFLVGYFTGKVRSMTAMMVGIVISAAAIFSLGLSMNGWVVLIAIAGFSLGELSASPTKMRYFASIAPPGKKALYLGYINATGGIGWYIGSKVAGELYEKGGDKVVLARRYLIEEQGMTEAAVTALKKTEVVPLLADTINGTPADVRELLWATYAPNQIWTTFALIGIVSMLGLLAFDQITKRSPSWEPWALTVLTFVTAFYCYGLDYAVFFGALPLIYLGVQYANPALLPGGEAPEKAA